MTFQLIDVLAKICASTQCHVADRDAWDHGRANLEQLFQCTSYTVACFLAHHTVAGAGGVEWDVVIDDLCDMPAKSDAWWREKMDLLIRDFGGVDEKTVGRAFTVTGSTFVQSGDLDTGESVEIRRLSNGLLIGIDSAFLEQMGDGDEIYSPYDPSVIVHIPDDET